ncbi:oligosaccharide flippase family protein [Actibacterium sp. MT2.3-13A]|uniref:oligosaccharide flippase family protein n=1 Tax=Actibacterium sp. MT2.3-13A TaxID=2828332 RepID=UPI001BABAB6F|nr:oligosaccharide flippase family protein [Actibacterium sp. MT2.3-13A]
MSRAVRGGIWTAVSRILSQVVQFAIFMVAVQVMSPAEFGIFALVWTWSLILSQFAIAGWPEYIMQWSGDSTQPRRVLALAMAGGAFLAGIGIALSYLAPLMIDDPRATPLMQIFAIWIFFASVGGTFAGAMNWEDRLTAAAVATIIGDLANFAVAVWALLQGHGVFALAAGRLVGALFWAGAGLAVVRMAPDFGITRQQAGEILRFTSRIVAVRLLVNIRLYAATLVIGTFLGAAHAGYFRAGQRLVSALGEVLGEPTRVLAWSLFRNTRRSQGPRVDFRERANSFFPVLLTFAIPLFAATAFLAEDITLGLLGEEWLPAAPVVRVLAIAYAVLATSAANEAVLSLAGMVRILPYMVLGNATLGVGITIIAAPHGILATAWAQVASALVIFSINAWMMQRHAAIRWGQVLLRLRAVPVALALSAAVPLIGGQSAALDAVAPLLRAVLLAAGFVVVFYATLLGLDGRLRRLVLQLARRRL